MNRGGVEEGIAARGVGLQVVAPKILGAPKEALAKGFNTLSEVRKPTPMSIVMVVERPL